ncbi:coiled-coil domain-containing protein 174 [Melanaphis sacchari]|nr:coiled-coil domain-containing protein 174 [Melanaphis sacchari]
MSKSLDICKSSLVSLKAELLRKQDEANKAKSFSGDTFIRPIPGAKTPSCLLQSNEGVEKRNAKDLEEEYTPDIENSLKKSRDVLTMKAKLYDKLVKGEMVSEQDKTFLVDFKQKVTESKTTQPVSYTKEHNKEQEKSDPDADLDKYDSGADDDWIDYTDFFGRTRRCLKTDLEFFKKRDQRIEKELEPPPPPPPSEMKQQTPITSQTFVKEGRNPEEISELFSSDMRREQLRLKWEEEEKKLAQRTDIHYEDIRFDEVREHGVGYYSFSTDVKERHRQQAELKKLREQTKTTQISVQKLKEKRAAQMAVRLRAIKRRKKEKLGLPMDSSSDEEAPPPKAPSPEIVEDIDAERAFEKLRKAAHVRPWDHGKDGLQKPLLTQEEWNEKQRAERKPDFAWNYDDDTKVPKRRSNNFKHVDEDDNEDDEDDNEDMVGPSLDMFIAPNNPNKQSTITPKNFKQFIHNELDDEPTATNINPSYDDDSHLDSIPLPTESKKGAEIAPPPTYEYYGPSGRGPKAQDNFISVNEMQDSISKGFSNVKNMNKPRSVRGIVDDDEDD